MKKFILISFLFLFSCGTRSVDKNKDVQKSEENTEQKSEVKKESESKETDVISTENNSESKSSSNVKISEFDKQNEAETKAKTDSETNETKYFFSEYFENGNLKSKTEYSANQSKLLQENSDLKKESEYYKSSAIAMQEENQYLILANSNLSKESRLKSDSIGIFKKQIENYSLQKSNKTERKSYHFWLWITVGFFLKILLNAFWKWFKTTSIFAKLPIIKFKN